MPPAFYALLSMLGVLFRSQLSLRAESFARETSWQIYQRTVKRPIIRPEDRILWSWLSRCRARWRDVLVCSIPWSGSCSLSASRHRRRRVAQDEVHPPALHNKPGTTDGIVDALDTS